MRIQGTTERPRLSVFRSCKHFYCQFIDDLAGATLLSGSTNTDEFRQAFPDQKSGNCSAGEALGKLVAAKAKERGITRIVFDRSGYRFHGRVKVLAETLRKEGIQF